LAVFDDKVGNFEGLFFLIVVLDLHFGVLLEKPSKAGIIAASFIESEDNELWLQKK